MKHTSLINFSLAPYIYAATFENSIIILDGKSDKYISLIDDAAEFFQLILSSDFTYNSDESHYLSTDLNQDSDLNNWISYFIKNNFIVPSTTKTFLNSPLEKGGLKEYRWDTRKISWKPFSTASIMDIIKAYYLLHKVHKTIEQKGIFGIISLLEQNAINGTISHNSSEEALQKLSAAVDAASLVYPKQTLCLAWAVTFTLLALQKKLKVYFVIGIQINPFYAHAWAETLSGKVINDDPRIAQALSIIFKI